MSRTRLSVIVPCHNAEAYLAQTLGALLEQSRPADEIIIIDDGSTDGSARIAEAFRRIDAEGGRIRVYSHRSGGASKTRQLGADLASGDRLMFLDADDVLAPDTIEGLELALDQEPAGVAVCKWRRLEREDGRWMQRPASRPPASPDLDALGNWLRGCYYPTSCVLWPRELFERTGGWDPAAHVNDDGDLVMRALASGAPLTVASRGLCLYRRLPDGRSFSDARLSDAGLAGRLWSIRKVAYWLELRGQLASHRASIGAAVLRLWHDARGRRDKQREIEATFRDFVGPAGRWRALVWSSGYRARLAARRARRRNSKPWSADAPAWGLARAERVEQASGRLPATIAASSPPRRPVVSVVVPAYNRAETLPRAVRSVLGQSFTDLELIVVDDASRDGTWDYLCALTDPRVRPIRRDRNGGPAAARNTGLQCARGEFVALLDSDDLWLPDKLAIQTAHHRRASPRVGLTCTGIETIRLDGVSRDVPSAAGDMSSRLLARQVLHGFSDTGMLRREVLAAVGGFDESFHAIEDYDLLVRIAQFYEIDVVDDILARYHDASSKGRVSRDAAVNQRSREQFFAKHASTMRRAGVAHRFLLDSAGRCLTPGAVRRARAAGLALRAVRHRLCSEAPLHAMAYLLLPGESLARWRAARQGRAAR